MGTAFNRSAVKPGAAAPRFGWSGFAILAPADTTDEAEKRRLALVARLLGRTRNSKTRIKAELLELRAAFHRNLHQDEFGPRAAEKLAALRTVSAAVHSLAGILNQTSDQSIEFICYGMADLTFSRSITPFDDAIVLTLCEASIATRWRLLQRTGADPRAISELIAASNVALGLLRSLDTNSQSEGFKTRRYPTTQTELGPQAASLTLRNRVQALCAHIDQTISMLEKKKGPSLSRSLIILIAQLCGLHQRGTGKPVSTGGWIDTSYPGRNLPRSAQFIYEAVEMMLPSSDWLGVHLRADSPVEARIYAGTSNGVRRRVRYALRHVTRKRKHLSKK